MAELEQEKKTFMEYDVSEWGDSIVTIEAAGKAPNKYGEGVFRFDASLTLSVILPKRGWILKKSTKHYAYLKPPTDILSPYRIQIKTPTHEQAIYIAKKCYESGLSWMGQLGEWPAWYRHEVVSTTRVRAPTKDGSSIPQEFMYEDPPETNLTIGEYGAWEITVSKTENGFEVYEIGAIER